MLFACILLNILFKKNTLSFFSSGSRSKKHRKEKKMMTEDIFEVDLQKIRDSDFPEIIKAEVQDFIIWNFNEALFELSTLFNILERGITFRVIDRCRDLNLDDTNLREICLCYENIAERLLNEEYRLLELVFPNTLYMKCINSLVF